MRYARTKRFADFEQEIDALSAKLAEILQADFAKSSDAHDPEYLKAAVGSGDSMNSISTNWPICLPSAPAIWKHSKNVPSALKKRG